MSKRSRSPDPESDADQEATRAHPPGFPWPDLLPELCGVIRSDLSYCDAFVLSLTCKNEQRAFAPTRRDDARGHYIRLFEALMAGGTVAQAACLPRLRDAKYCVHPFLLSEYVSYMRIYFRQRTISQEHDEDPMLAPLLLAVDNDNVALVRWCREETNLVGEGALNILGRYAASRGSLQSLAYLTPRHDSLNSVMLGAAAMHGNVASIAWLRQNKTHALGYTHYNKMLRHAVYYGTLDCLNAQPDAGIVDAFRNPASFARIAKTQYDAAAFYMEQDRKVFGAPRSTTGPAVPVDLDRSRVAVAEWLAAKLIDPRVHPAYRRACTNGTTAAFAQMLLDRPKLVKRYLQHAPAKFQMRICGTCKHRHRCQQHTEPGEPASSSSSSSSEASDSD